MLKYRIMSVWTRWKTAEGTCITRKSIQEDCAANAHAQQENDNGKWIHTIF